MANTTFIERKIVSTITLGQGSFGEDGEDSIVVSGLRTSVTINKTGGPAMGTLDMKIWGLSLDKMNKLTALSREVMIQRNNQIIISAGDDVNGMGVVFQGTIVQGWADMRGAPDVYLYLSAMQPGLAAVKPVAPTSYPGTADVATVMASCATQMGLGFENNGVGVTLTNPYFPGTALQQAEKCAQAANINWVTDDRVLAIWPKGGSRSGDPVEISTRTGMIGYPGYNGTGISVQTLFNPSIQFGGKVLVDSTLKPACGTWFVASLTHLLDCYMPEGQWFTSVEGYPLFTPPPQLGTAP